MRRTRGPCASGAAGFRGTAATKSMVAAAARAHPHAHRRSRNRRGNPGGRQAGRDADHRADGVRRLLPRARGYCAVVHGRWLVPHRRPVRTVRRRRTSLRFYRFIGRLKQIIIRGGVKIAPEELDTALSQMPDVLEGAVTGYRDEIMGERICAVVVPCAGATPTLESVRAHFAAVGLARSSIPSGLRRRPVAAQQCRQGGARGTCEAGRDYGAW